MKQLKNKKPEDRVRGDISRQIDQTGQMVLTYKPGHTIDSNLNVVPNSVVRIGSTKAMLLQGTPAQDVASALGVFGSIAAMAYFPFTARGIIGDRYVLTDVDGQAWVIHGRPTQSRMPGVVGIEALVTRMQVRPDGI